MGATVLIADHAPMRRGIQMVLAEHVDICAEAEDAQEAIRVAKRERPDVCLVGRELPGDWLAAVRGVCRASPGVGVGQVAGL